MTVISLSPATAYMTKPNIHYPGTQAQADAVETAAEARLNDSLRGGVNQAWTVDTGDGPDLKIAA